MMFSTSVKKRAYLESTMKHICELCGYLCKPIQNIMPTVRLTLTFAKLCHRHVCVCAALFDLDYSGFDPCPFLIWIIVCVLPLPVFSDYALSKPMPASLI